MADDANFLELLHKPMSDFPDRPNFPGDSYFFGKLIGVAAARSSKQETPFFNFEIRPTEPGKDVPASALQPIIDGGFTLADYTAEAQFYITPKAMTMFRRFLTSIGFPESTPFFEALALNPETGEPTEETQERIRGKKVMFKTQSPFGDQKIVFLSKVASIVGVKDD